jgi:hypothetical protein
MINAGVVFCSGLLMLTLFTMFTRCTGYIYPALLTALVPLRSYILARCFTEADLKHLDPFDESEEDYREEQKAIRLAERQGSFDEDDIEFPSRAMFRGAGELRQRRRHSIGHAEDLLPENSTELEVMVATQMADHPMMRMADAVGRSKDLLQPSAHSSTNGK